MTKTALVFPGQGSQKVGMGKAFYDAFPIAREVFQEVDQVLGQHLTRLMFEGPEQELTLTANAQPAIMACSIAALRVLEKEAGFKVSEKAAFVAGHSLGEYSALTAAGTFTLADTARLLRIRGSAMQEAVPEGQGTMAAILGLDLSVVEEILRSLSNAPHPNPLPEGEREATPLQRSGVAGEGVCEIANDNSPGQVVISGEKAVVEAAMEHCKAKGAKRALPLPVSAPFHCSLMAPAAKKMDEALKATTMKTPSVPLVANITASSVTDPNTIRELLVQQVTGRVRWTESVQYLKSQSIERIIEIGEGNVLSGLIKRIDKEIVTYNISKPEDIEAVLKAA